jgi:hypothetical protein
MTGGIPVLSLYSTKTLWRLDYIKVRLRLEYIKDLLYWGIYYIKGYKFISAVSHDSGYTWRVYQTLLSLYCVMILLRLSQRL